LFSNPPGKANDLNPVFWLNASCLNNFKNETILMRKFLVTTFILSLPSIGFNLPNITTASQTQNFGELTNARTALAQSEIRISTPSEPAVGLAPSVTSGATDYYRSNVASGYWNDPASWESSPNNITWNIATLRPTSAAKTITIRTGHAIMVNTNITLDETIVEGTLETQAGSKLNY
jgi:hypothetical protein